MATSVPFPKSRMVEKSFVVENFSSMMEQYKPGERVTKDFPFGDESITILVLPNGPNEDDKGWVGLGLWMKGKEEVKVNMLKINLAGKTWMIKESETRVSQKGLYLYCFKVLSHEECRAGLKAGGLEVTVELELAAKVDSQENGHSLVKNDSEHDSVKATIKQEKDLEIKDEKKVYWANDGSVTVVEVNEKVQSKKVNIEKEEAVLKYHEIVIDLKASQLICSACKTRPRRCKVFQCSLGHLVCEACLPSLTTCPVCNTSLPEPHYRNICAELCIASIGEVD